MNVIGGVAPVGAGVYCTVGGDSCDMSGIGGAEIRLVFPPDCCYLNVIIYM